MSEKKLVKDLHEQVTSGKAEVHTKTKKNKEEDKKVLENKRKRAFVGTPILLTATLYKLEELQEMGAVKMKTKMLVNQTIESMKHDLDTMFDGIGVNTNNSAGMLDEGARYLEEGLDKFLTHRTKVDEE